MVAHGMMMVACALPTTGLVAYHLPILILGFYYATPENEWAEVILPHVPEWMAPRDPGAVRYFFEGLPDGEAVPWDALGPAPDLLGRLLRRPLPGDDLGGRHPAAPVDGGGAPRLPGGPGAPGHGPRGAGLGR